MLSEITSSPPSARPMRVLELFAGGGGAALGLHDAGFEHVACVERDPSAAATLRAAGFPAVEADVRDVDYDAMTGTIDLLWASPPCQVWSGLGKRQGARDRERNGWPWTLDILERVRPTWAVMENVPGMLQHPYLKTVVFPRLRPLFGHVDAGVLNAADFGLPQARRRLFIVAGPLPFVWPRASHGADAPHPHLTVRDALRLGPDVVAMAHECNAGWGLARVPVSLDQPAPTLTAGSTRSHGGNGLLLVKRGARLDGPLPSGSKLHRRATPAECATLQGFPSDYAFVGNATARRAQIGNAVPPVLASKLGRAVIASELRRVSLEPIASSMLERATAAVRGHLDPYVGQEDVNDYVERHAEVLHSLALATASRQLDASD